MKKILKLGVWFIGLFLFIESVSAQDTNVITNKKLLQAILNNPISVDSNGDGIVTKSEAESYTYNLYLWNAGLTNSDINELSYFKNVTGISLENNNISDLTTLKNLSKLEYISLEKNPILCSVLNDYQDCEQVYYFQNKNISVSWSDILVYDSTKITESTPVYKVLITIVDDIDATFTRNGETINAKYTMTDTDKELIIVYAKLFELYVEKLTNYKVNLDIEIYETKNTVTNLPENGYSVNGEQFMLFGSTIPEIKDLISNYDSNIVVAYSHYDSHDASGYGGFSYEISRGEVYLPYDAMAYSYLVYVFNELTDAERLSYVKTVGLQSVDEYYNIVNELDKNPGKYVDALIKKLSSKIDAHKKELIASAKNGYPEVTDVDGFVHEFAHTLEQYSTTRGYSTWEFHDAINVGKTYPGLTINEGRIIDKEAIYFRGMVNPENNSEYGIRDEIYANSPTKYYTTTLTNIDATNISIITNEDSYTLSWDSIADATIYKLIRYTNTDDTYDIVYFGSDTTYIDNDIKLGTTYYYKVVVVKNNDLETISSVDSNVVTGFIKKKEVEKAPSVKISASNNAITLTWGKVDNAVSYNVLRSTSSSGTYTTVAKGLTSLKYTDKSLTYGTTYYYKVVAVGEANSKTSSVVSKKIVPNQVVNVVAKPGVKKVVLTWDKVATTGYQVYQSLDNKTWSKVATITKNGTLEYTVTGLSENKVHYYKVRAYSTVNKTTTYGAFSSVITTRTAPKTPTISVKTINYTTINVTVNNISGATKYQVYRSTSKNGTYTKIGTSAKNTYTDKTVKKNTTYYYKVRAFVTYDKKNIYSGYSTYTSIKVTK